MPAPWRTIRVFISSTFRDMQAERDWLVRFVFPRLREELVKYHIHFVDVDLRWGVTSDQNALGVCREVIDECHPRFMCMLGGRYGWVPEGQDKSITADEIHYGVLGREAERRGHAFFYFRDDRATARMVEATPGDFREPDGSTNATKLANLKKAITDAGLPGFIYDAHWDAAQKRLIKLEAFGDKVYADLLQSLKDDSELAARFTTEGTAPPDEFTEESEQMEAFIEERTERYVTGSREPMLRDLLAFATADATPNIFVLTGEPGSGKSAFLAEFVAAVLSPQGSAKRSKYFGSSAPFGGHPFLLIPHFIGASTGSTDLRRTLRRLCHDLTPAAGNTEPLPLDIKELITHFQELLAEAAGRRRVILVFDALNQFDATDGAHWLNWLPRPNELPPGVRIVASVIAPADGQPEHQTLAILRMRPGTRLEKLEPLTEADTLAVIEGSLRRYAKRLSPEQLAALLAKPAGRLPLYVLTALEELRTLGTYEEITARIRALPGDARALFGWILTERLARDPGFRDREGRPCGAALVEKFAACLSVSRHGLSPAELTALLDPGDPLGNVAALLRLLRPYPNHQYIHTNGALRCCDLGGCWKARTVPLGDGDAKDLPENLCVDVVEKLPRGRQNRSVPGKEVSHLPRCMDMITSEEVCRRIELYFSGGAVRYLNPHEWRHVRSQLRKAIVSPGIGSARIHTSEPPNTSRILDANWLNWVRVNLERKCTLEAITKILLDNGFAHGEIKSAMGKSYPQVGDGIPPSRIGAGGGSP
jgi:hypothetical protein